MAKTDAFDKHSDRYEEWFENNSQTYRAEVNLLRQMLPQTAAKSLEIGVGTGRFAKPLGVTAGVEPSKKMAAIARQKGIDVYTAQAEKLPFDDETFDAVLMVTTICFVDDAPAAVREMFRVVKNGGCAVVGFVDKNSELGKTYRKNQNQSTFYSQAVFFSVQEVQDLLQAAGFKDIRIRQTLFPGDLQRREEGFGTGAFVSLKGYKTP